jgi:hypothetical protein
MFYTAVGICLVPFIAMTNVGGLLLSLFFGLCAIPLWKRALRPGSNIRLTKLFKAFKTVLWNKTFVLFVFMGVNVWVFFNISLNTLIPTYLLISVLVLSIVLGYWYVRKNEKIARDPFNRSLYGLVLFPGIIQSVLVLNFVFSSSPTLETYRYKLWTTKMYWRYSKTPSIDYIPLAQLEDDVYYHYFGARLVWRPGPMESSQAIEFEFEKGLLGISVLKSYRFIKRGGDELRW